VPVHNSKIKSKTRRRRRRRRNEERIEDEYAKREGGA
jgi:hypothetical protein